MQQQRYVAVARKPAQLYHVKTHPLLEAFNYARLVDTFGPLKTEAAQLRFKTYIYILYTRAIRLNR